MERVTVIQKSLTVFTCGLLGLVPILGAPFALYAARCWAQVQARYHDGWNPAEAYLSWGARMALIGLFGSMSVVCLAALLFVFHEFDWMGQGGG